MQFGAVTGPRCSTRKQTTRLYEPERMEFIMENSQQPLVLKVKGMTCPTCAYHVQEAVLSLDGVKTVTIDNWRNGETRVEVKPGTVTPEQIVKAIWEAGYTAVL
jgi:copper chaperone CopZ